MLAVALGVLGAAACSSTDAGKAPAAVSAAGGASSLDGADAGATLDSKVAADSGDDRANALCDTFFGTLVKCPAAGAYLEDRGVIPYGFEKLPATEIERLRSRYRAHCTERLALPGTGFDGASIGACLSAIDSEGCVLNPATQAACTFKGTLPAGASCVVAEQCADFDCFSVSNCTMPTGPFGASPSCGVCRKAPVLGEACDGGQSCGPNAVCVLGKDSTNGSGICTARTVRAAGEACSDGASVCADGLFCDFAGPGSPPGKTVCKVLGGEGAACSPGGCKAPFVCNPGAAQTPGSFTCQRPPIPTAETVKFAEPGAACDSSTRCKIGYCTPSEVTGADGRLAPSAKGTCPKIIADGDPCIGGAPPSAGALAPPGAIDGVCDTFSSCVNGKCTKASYPTCGSVAPDAPLVCPGPLVIACPKAAPTAGDACPSPTPAPGQSVSYPSECAYDSGKTHCGCAPSIQAGSGPAGLAWTCETCPVTQPTAGEACGTSGPTFPKPRNSLCTYGDATCGCDTGPGASEWACGACPATVPASGDACDVPMGMACDFGDHACTCIPTPPSPGSGNVTEKRWSCP